MITNAEIKEKIKRRAFMAYLRDVKKLGQIVNERGEISIYDVMEQVERKNKQQKRRARLSKTPILKWFYKSDEFPVVRDFDEFILSFMSNLQLETLSFNNMSDVDIKKEYANFKTEYEFREEILFRTLDLRYFTADVVIGGGKENSESAENY